MEAKALYTDRSDLIGMTVKIEVSEELKERIDGHLEEGETPAEFIEELLNIYESEGAFLQEGYSE